MTDQRTYPYGYKSIHGGTARGMGHPHQQEVSISNRRARVQAKKSYKILLIGESSVGKTTMAVRLCEDRFMLNPTSKPTLGIDMCETELLIDGESLKIQLWDTCGQECYDSITTSYYRGASGIVVAYDVTSRRTFDRLERWFDYIETHATADVPIMLLATKCDLNSRREVEADYGKKYADTHNVDLFYEVSAKTSLNIRESFTTFVKEVHRKAIENKAPREKQEPDKPDPGKKCCLFG